MSSINNLGNTPTNTPSTAATTSGQDSSSKSLGTGEDYPEQIHAGAVGYGPNYHAGPTLADKVQGLKDELKGKITGNPDLVHYGREVKSGEERRKKLTGENDVNDPFAKPTESEDKHTSTDPTSKPSDRTEQTSNPETAYSHPRHQSHPMRPSDSAQSHHMDHPDSSKSAHLSDTSTNIDTDSTHAPGLNGPIGLRDGKIQTIVGTPDLPPTTASQQPAIQKEQQPNTHSQFSSQNSNIHGSHVSEGPDNTISQTRQDNPFLENWGNSPNSPACLMGMGYRDGEEVTTNKPSGHAQQGDRYGVENAKTRLAHEPYKKETIGQGGDAIISASQDQVRSDKNLMDNRNKGRGSSVTFDDIAGRSAPPEATRADATSMPPQY